MIRDVLKEGKHCLRNDVLIYGRIGGQILIYRLLIDYLVYFLCIRNLQKPFRNIGTAQLITGQPWQWQLLFDSIYKASYN